MANRGRTSYVEGRRRGGSLPDGEETTDTRPGYMSPGCCHNHNSIAKIGEVLKIEVRILFWEIEGGGRCVELASPRAQNNLKTTLDIETLGVKYRR